MDMNMELWREKREQVISIAFIAIAAILIMIGIWALETPVVSMCVLVILEAAIAGTLHHAELWVHGALLLVELIAGIAAGKLLLVVMCVLLYAAALAMLQEMDKGEAQNG
jgi:hypothetical protein